MKVWDTDEQVLLCEHLPPRREQELFKGKKSGFCFIT